MARARRRSLRRSTRARRGGGPWLWLGRAGWTLALVALLGVLGLAGWGAARTLLGREAVDEASLCPASGPRGALVVLLDLTDPLGPAQAARLRGLIDAEVARARAGTMVSLGVVSAEAGEWGVRFARCKPQGAEEASALTQNPRLVAETFEASFAAPLRQALEGTMAAQAQDASPIMEALQALLAETPAATDTGGPVTLVLASDLIQNSAALSFYRGEGWEAFEAAGGPGRLARTLGGAEVVLLRVPRPEAGEAAGLVDPFWSRYLDRQGAAAPFREAVLGDL